MKQITLDGVTYNLTPAEKTRASPFHVSDTEMTWAQAMGYADKLGIRLLRSEELHVLARDGHLPVNKGWAWSSSSVSNNTSYAWYVYLGNGLTDYGGKNVTYRAVCVAVDFSLGKFLAAKGVAE